MGEYQGYGSVCYTGWRDDKEFSSGCLFPSSSLKSGWAHGNLKVKGGACPVYIPLTFR